MIEDKFEHTKTLRDEDGGVMATIDICNGNITLNIVEVYGVPEWQEFHQALGEAIQIAEAQNNER
jgi:hypothetical protein